MAASKISNFFKKKPPKLRQESTNDSDDDDGYQDPITSCPTEPPINQRISALPSYPPPRPSSPRAGKKVPPPGRRDDYQDPWDSKNSKQPDTPGNRKSLGTYQDPFDSKMKASQQDYADPFDTKFNGEKEKYVQEQLDQDYDEPYEQNKPQAPSLNDTYEDPWDTKRSIDLGESLNRPKSVAPTQVMNVKKPPRRDDYSDPWDTKTSGSLNAEEYDDTYSEPYDKGKQSILDEPRRKSVPDTADDDDLYDMPFEEKVAIGIATPIPHSVGDGRSISSQFSTQRSDSPKQPPPKPPMPYSGAGGDGAVAGGGGDYDSPWEWKKDFEKEFEKRFSVGDITKPSAPQAPPRKKTTNNANINPVAKPNRTNVPQPEVQEVVGFQVDPTIPLENQGWFHGRIGRGEAETLLHNQPDCSYMVRNSESSKTDYSMSLRNRGEPMHLKISYKEGKYILGINSRPYDTIPEMIHHYSMNMLNIRGAEHVKLQYPVFQENMYFTVEPGS